MMFDHIIGNPKIKDYLTHTVQRGKVGNSLLFAGPDGIGKSLFAEAFAKLLLCQNDFKGSHRQKIESGNHPDIHMYRPEGKVGMHSIASMRQFSEEVYLAPFEAQWKVFIIHEADRMLPYSANALLKTFEEPAPDAVIILLSSSPSALLPTVLSRCRTLHFQPIPEREIVSFLIQRFKKTDEEAQAIAHMAQGSIGQAVRLIQGGENPVRSQMLKVLAGGKVMHFKEVSAMAAEIAERVETGKKEVEAELRNILLRGTGEDLSATQKQGIEKEVDGAIAMHAMQEAQTLFEIILAWYRDVHLLTLHGDAAYLFHRDYAAAIQEVAKKGNPLSIEEVQKAIADARLALERSTSLHICLENLFLKLNFL